MSLILVWLFVVWMGEIGFNGLEISFLDVGQGDAALIRTPGGENILIDGGPGDYVIVELGEILPPWDREIDIVILTHPHDDHFAGLLDVVERYEVGEFWWNPVEYARPEYMALIKMLDAEGCLVRAVVEGDFQIERNVTLCILWPKSWEKSDSEWCADSEFECNRHFDDNLNNDSVVVMLKYRDFEALFMGDAEIEVEERLIEAGLLVDVDLLKAGHHCSRTASSGDFLAVVKPEIAVCSYGEENKFGHPHREAIENFEEFGVEMRSTADYGTITFRVP